GVSKGQTDIELQYIRPWENTESLYTFKITVISGGVYEGSEKPYIISDTKDKKIAYTPNKALPSSFNWVDHHIMTPVKNQGSCGSCWAFANCGVFEALINARDVKVTDLSEQWFVNCSTNSPLMGHNAGCQGGYFGGNEFTDLGCVYEPDEPYTQVNGTCDVSYAFHEKADGYKIILNDSMVPPPVDTIKYYLYYYGPLWITFAASSTQFQQYKSGVFTYDDPAAPDHAVVLTGWDDANQCWIVKNSWGIGWGENGYFRMKWNVCRVGAWSCYIKYKGLYNQNAKPTANYVADDITTCDGVVNFTDRSQNIPSSWNWDFGDGQNSTSENPSHTFLSNGTYTVKLKSTNSYGSDSITKANFVVVNRPTAPATTGGSANQGSSVTLTATGVGTLYWYTTSTGGTSIGTGASITVSPTITTDYYVEDQIASAAQNVGKVDSTGGGGFFTANYYHGLLFDAMSPLTIKSIKFYSNKSANRQIDVLNASTGAVVATKTVSISNGMNTVTLNIALPAGTGYFIKISGSTPTTVNLYRNSTGPYGYPYAINNLISINASDINANYKNSYYYFYNWQVQAQNCISPRTKVTATIIPTGVNEINSQTSIDVYPNPTDGKFYISINGSTEEFDLSIYNIQGQKIISQQGIRHKAKVDVSNLQSGIYFFKITNNTFTKFDKIVVVK
ncbi:MAG: C1 family peptidase, partial [Bacteroidales bacterium]|nr:C1 family peptidase [Bacteroidales bacterium]